jgi:hypothetical protein
MKDFILLDYLFVCPGHLNENHSITEYIDFLNTHAIPNRIAGKTNNHHVLPKSLCKTIGIPERMQDAHFNRAHLLTKDHIKAHIILWQCFRSRETAGGIGMIFNIKKINKKINDLSDEDIRLTAEALDYFHSCEETRLRARQGQLGRKATLATREKMSKSIKESQKFIDSKSKSEKISKALSGRKVSLSHAEHNRQISRKAWADSDYRMRQMQDRKTYLARLKLSAGKMRHNFERVEYCLKVTEILSGRILYFVSPASFSALHVKWDWFKKPIEIMLKNSNPVLRKQQAESKIWKFINDFIFEKCSKEEFLQNNPTFKKDCFVNALLRHGYRDRNTA